MPTHWFLSYEDLYLRNKARGFLLWEPAVIIPSDLFSQNTLLEGAMERQ